jgi:hypothetical protein
MNANVSPRDQQIIEARAASTTRAEFCRLIGLGDNAAWYHVKRLNLQRFGHVKPAPAETTLKVCELFKSGQSVDKIAAQFGYTRGKVAGIINRAGLFKKRVLGRKPKLSPQRKTRSGGPKSVKFRADPFTERAAVVVPLMVEFLDRDMGRQCAQPYSTLPEGEPWHPAHIAWCGHPCYGTLPYCLAHSQINYRPAEARNRAPRPR